MFFEDANWLIVTIENTNPCVVEAWEHIQLMPRYIDDTSDVFNCKTNLPSRRQRGEGHCSSGNPTSTRELWAFVHNMLVKREDENVHQRRIPEKSEKVRINDIFYINAAMIDPRSTYLLCTSLNVSNTPVGMEVVIWQHPRYKNWVRIDKRHE